ncbi:unnamed protein product [Adineta ricciae]|uniref:Macro domain-containing protein n=1 Tax=Adineta ricciae TaxID=249248 RepID=A0A813RIX0_ADIRI|nr:unnamed protein product [Adineta ricciae]CAF0785188.1 unnamed protein product [Adineta ricciae]
MSGVIIENPDENTAVFTFANGSLKVTIRRGDLSREACDAIVNPTNVTMLHNGGLDTQIHRTLGSYFTDQVVAVNKKFGHSACPIGQSRIFIAKFNREESSPGFVINTVGPFYKAEEAQQSTFHLQSCYYTSLAIANLYSLSSIAYPAISCGAYRFPLNDAAKIGIQAIRDYSNQVKDVRFVLFDKPVFTVFVQEWTNYCQAINREANIDEEREQPSTPPPTPPISSTVRRCILCKQKSLENGQPYLCRVCLNLTRSDAFSKLLQQLRSAADISFKQLQDDCVKLKPILSLYSLVYTPVEVFHQSIHPRDHVAEHFLQCHCDKQFRDHHMPVSIIGDGNCFYNSFVKLSGTSAAFETSTITPVELRARNIIELVLNRYQYEDQHRSLSEILDPFEPYVTKEMVRDGTYVGVWDFLSIATVLSVNIITVYPNVNGNSDLNYTKLNAHEFKPLLDASSDQSKSTFQTVKILFSNCNKPLKSTSSANKGWTPNHFVPLLNIFY